MTIARVLPRQGWHRLAGTELEAAVPFLPPDTRVLVVERDGVILACHAIAPYWHLEGLWVHPDHRHSVIGPMLWGAVQREAQALKIGAVITGAISDDVRALIARVGGVQLPGDAYVIPIPEGVR